MKPMRRTFEGWLATYTGRQCSRGEGVPEVIISNLTHDTCAHILCP